MINQILSIHLAITMCGKILEGENIGKFGKWIVIRQIFTLQIFCGNI